MEIKEYKLSKETSALMTCIEELTELQGHVFEALEMFYDEAQIGGEGVEGKIGSKLFDALGVARDELFAIMDGEIVQNLCTTSKEKEI